MLQTFYEKQILNDSATRLFVKNLMQFQTFMFGDLSCGKTFNQPSKTGWKSKSFPNTTKQAATGWKHMTNLSKKNHPTTNQPSIQTVNQLTSQSANPSTVNQLTRQPAHQPIRQPPYQTTSQQPAIQPISQSANQAIIQTANQTTSQ
jgi:hypothetical protein